MFHKRAVAIAKKKMAPSKGDVENKQRRRMEHPYLDIGHREGEWRTHPCAVYNPQLLDMRSCRWERAQRGRAHRKCWRSYFRFPLWRKFRGWHRRISSLTIPWLVWHSIDRDKIHTRKLDLCSYLKYESHWIGEEEASIQSPHHHWFWSV